MRYPAFFTAKGSALPDSVANTMHDDAVLANRSAKPRDTGGLQSRLQCSRFIHFPVDGVTVDLAL
jgi:hypothetical protein